LLQYNASISAFQWFAIDPTTFAPTLQPAVTVPSETMAGFSIDFSGKYLYTTNRPANSVSSYRIDTTTGGMTLVNTVPAGSQPFGVSAFGLQPQ
jgi:YVTN family beta-propeller protein